MLTEDQRLIIEARHHDPFGVLGCHATDNGNCTLQVFRPNTTSLAITGVDTPMERVGDTDFFTWAGSRTLIPEHYEIQRTDSHGDDHRYVDPYSFPPEISEFDLHLFGEGRHLHAYRFLGAHPGQREGIDGTRFAVWAPNAERVSVVGEFNQWDGRINPMVSRGGSGIWELFIPGVEVGQLYKYEIRNRHGGSLHTKTDPYGRQFELRPDTAARVPAPLADDWTDQSWMEDRANDNWLHAPFSVYEVHLGSWRRSENGEFLNYRELAGQLVAYALEFGFTHLELLPVSEHPLDASWGYQATGFFAPTSRFGTPEDFRWFVNHAHENGIGIILDWVPGHFPKDDWALARFDGTPLYEHPDPKRGEHRDWGTYIFDYGRNEVRCFLLANALYWLEEFHIDGLRVDAVASMLYLDYSREDGDWEPNQYGGNENLEALAFLRQLNEEVHARHPGAMVIAEESTAWPQVTRPTYLGGLGFSMKWNMGWMHDTLLYMSKEPIHRSHHHELLTFGLLYSFTENFVLPLSHDEVVHGKRSLLSKMPGDRWQQFANLRLLYTAMWTYPGKKLLFMGGEFGQANEWNFDTPLDWWLLDHTEHDTARALIRDLNRIYRDEPALHRNDFQHEGFEWIDCHDHGQSVVSYLRRDGDRFVVVVLNFTPVPREGYRIGVPEAGHYSELLNSDSTFYGGSNVGNAGIVSSEPKPWMQQSQSLAITLPPLGAVILVRSDQ